MFASFIASIVLLRPVAGYPLTEARAQAQDQHDLNIPDSPDHNTDPILNNLQSFSLEFSFFPDFAGNNSHPNEFSKTLLDNLKDITGTPPVIRVGGTTQYFPPSPLPCPFCIFFFFFLPMVENGR